MEASSPARILVVTDRPADNHALLAAIGDRAQRGPTQLRVLVPYPAPAEWHPLHPERHDHAAEAEELLAQALPAIEAAAGGPVIGSISIRHDAMDAIESTLHDEPFDEIMIAMAPHHTEQRLHVDLPHRVAHLGLPVTTVTEAAAGQPG
ncbi:MAG TPA: hypothetical protein VII98_13305 [Solirubrobacteraceae bacterium]